MLYIYIYIYIICYIYIHVIMKTSYYHNGFDKVCQSVIKITHRERVGKICPNMKLTIDSSLHFTPETFLFLKSYFLHFYAFTLFYTAAFTLF